MNSGAEQKYAYTWPEALHHLKDRVIRALKQPQGRGNRAWNRLEVQVDGRDIMAWLQGQTLRPRMYWRQRDGFYECAALGCLAMMTDEGACSLPDVLSRIRSQLKHSARGIKFWGGCAFDPQNLDDEWRGLGAFRFVLPRLELYREGQSYFLACHFSCGADRVEDTAEFFDHIKDPCPASGQGRPCLTGSRTEKHVPDFLGWRKNVNDIRMLIRQKQVEKVVLARKTSFTAFDDRDVFDWLNAVEANHVLNRHYLFAFQWGEAEAFMGASPECLFSRNGRNVHCEALAGTSPRGETGQQDRDFHLKLRQSCKDLQEHRYVVEMIEKTLGPCCHVLNSGKQPEVLSLKTGFHLLTLFAGQLNEGITDQDLLSRLHPTPAVAGTPTQTALKLIRELEPFSRGWYAGPYGYLGAEQTEFCVAIRAGLWTMNRFSLFAGAGIVRDSDPVSEWEEVNYKLTSYLERQPAEAGGRPG